MNIKKIILMTGMIMAIEFSGVAMAAPGTGQGNAPEPMPPVSSGFAQFMSTIGEIGKVKPPMAEEMTAPGSSGIVAVAQGLLGRPTLWGGTSPVTGFDCSGFVQYVFRKVGIELPRTADIQFLVGRTVARTALRPGDLVYFTTYEPGASHVGIYIGRDKFIHTSYASGVVAVADLNDDYFTRRYYGAKRIG